MSCKEINQVIKMLEKLSNSIKPTKDSKVKKATKSTKSKSIDDCETKTELAKFSVTELKKWLKENNVSVKKVTEKHKKDWVNIVWENLFESDSDSDSGSDSESDSDSDCDSE